MTTSVLLSTEDVLVVGPPTSIEVDLDIGAKGERGSRIFSYEESDPAVGMSAIGQDTIPYDMYVSLDKNNEYLTAYQYVSNFPSQGYTWKKVFNFYPRQYRKNVPIIFNDGIGQKTIIVTEITPLNDLANINAENFSINYSIEYQNPIASSIESISFGPGLDDFLNLTINIKALEYKNESWIPLNSVGEGIIVHFDIRVV
ncbi:hypothetical protein EB001_20110 [bacterium]|nr:hypothetical protein [bacterium]